MSTQDSAWSQSTSLLLFALDTAVNVTADVVSELTRFVPNTFHRHMSDSLLPESAQKVMPFVRYIKSNASNEAREAVRSGLNELISARTKWSTADPEQRLQWSETINDIRSSIKGIRPSDRAARSCLPVVEHWTSDRSTPYESPRARGDIAKADRRWTRPVVVVGAVVTLTGSIIYDISGKSAAEATRGI